MTKQNDKAEIIKTFDIITLSKTKLSLLIFIRMTLNIITQSRKKQSITAQCMK